MTFRTAIALTSTALLVAFGAPATAQDSNDPLPDGPAKAIIVRACTSCHQPTVIISKPHTAEEWDDIIGKMIGRGAQLTDAEQDQIYAYLAKNFGPKAAVPAAAPGALAAASR